MTLADPVARAKLEGRDPARPRRRARRDRQPGRVPRLGQGVLRHRHDVRRRRRDDAGQRRPVSTTFPAAGPRLRSRSRATARRCRGGRRVARPAIRSGRLSRTAGSNFACTPSGRRPWSCCCSTRPTTTRRARHPRRRHGRPDRRPYWHAFVPGHRRRARCTPSAPTARGRRSAGCGSTATRILLDPYGRGRRVPDGYHARPAAPDRRPAMKSVVVDPDAYDWEGDRPLGRPLRGHGHLRGPRPRLHRPSELRRRAARRGTYAGFIEKIPYLVGPRRHRRRAAAGVRVRPARRARRPAATTGATSRCRSSRRTPRTAAGPDAQAAVDEFRDLVKALHRAGLEVILDVVYNHTAEGGAGRADVLLPRPRQRRVLPRSTGRPVPLRRLQRHRQHPQRQRARSSGG